MEDRTDLPKIKPREKPSLFNEGMTDGMLTGWMLGSWGFLWGNKTTERIWLGVEAAAIAIGGLLGGFEGKRKQEQAQTHGRTVSTPTYLNLGILNGMAVAYVATLAAQVIPGLHVSPVSPLAMVGYIGSMAVGSHMRYATLRRDFNDAVALQKKEMDTLRAQLKEHVTNVAPEETKRVDQISEPKKSHTERLQHAEASTLERV